MMILSVSLSHTRTFSFDVVCTLTDSGKNIQYMEEEIGNLILFLIFSLFWFIQVPI